MVASQTQSIVMHAQSINKQVFRHKLSALLGLWLEMHRGCVFNSDHRLYPKDQHTQG